uniref:Uncharacterized protein n=1 Tax=mine drainage metagenome TaxID=410659 RepID=E6PHQ6_9ZZZZ
MPTSPSRGSYTTPRDTIQNAPGFSLLAPSRRYFTASRSRRIQLRNRFFACGEGREDDGTREI